MGEDITNYIYTYITHEHVMCVALTLTQTVSDILNSFMFDSVITPRYYGMCSRNISSIIAYPLVQNK